MGLSGLMIWAIDLDDNWRTALSAVSNIKSDKRVATEFTQADIENLFPADKLPNDGAVSNYALINFGGSSSQGDMNPSNTGFGFMMITGDSFAVTNLKKRQGQPDPFVFLDCPGDVESRPPNETLRARVACLSDDVQGCFRVLERGIEGTIVDMPENASALNDILQCSLLIRLVCTKQIRKSHRVESFGRFAVCQHPLLSCSDLY